MTDRLIELEREDARRKALEDAAAALEKHATNENYQKALKLGANLIRRMMGKDTKASQAVTADETKL